MLEDPAFANVVWPAFVLGLANINVGNDFGSLLFDSGRYFFSALRVPNTLPSLPLFAFNQLMTSVNFSNMPEA